MVWSLRQVSWPFSLRAAKANSVLPQLFTGYFMLFLLQLISVSAGSAVFQEAALNKRLLSDHWYNLHEDPNTIQHHVGPK